MRTASKLLILLCLMSKKAKGSLKYSSLEEALQAIRTTVLGSEDFTHSEKVLNSEEFSYYERTNSEGSTHSEEFSYYGKSNSEDASNLQSLTQKKSNFAWEKAKLSCLAGWLSFALPKAKLLFF